MATKKPMDGMKDHGLWTAEQTAAALGIALSTLYNRKRYHGMGTRKGVPLHFEDGGRLFFDPEDVAAFKDKYWKPYAEEPSETD